ncbi:hypothetical protein DES38_10797 [Streptohalobacillus salinus]|uniref:Membrane protein YczE n=1 Tax=Streptohalobacillus salinus TaxID=621096 RepID=A0A2V3WFG9_9BACI|nr:membrane protein [Streptohalobacillus salinus]PXW90965.1 hypothetical protein DES38_10797 [Streptohalobacillus salinus]
MRKSTKRILVVIFGNVLLGIAIGVLRIGGMGTDPFATMNLGVSSTLGLTFGVYQVIFNALLFIVLIANSRELIGFGTLINMTILGFISDFIVFGFDGLAFDELSLFVRLTLLFLGIILSSLGLSLYVTANLGVSPYDALPLMIQKATGQKLSFGVARIIVDVTAVLIGFLFGAIVGVGTLMIALLLGPLTTVINKRISEPFIYPKARL